MFASGRRGFLKVGAGASVALGLPRALAAAAETAAVAPAAPAVLSTLDAIERRRSVRRFKPTPVPDEHLHRILDAARLAPTFGNQQPWRFLVVRDRAKLDRIKQEILASTEESLRRQGVTQPEVIEKRKGDITPYIDGLLSAPVHVVVLVDTTSKYPTYNVKDGTLAAGQLMLAARALGYGTVFLTDGIPEHPCRRALAIPDRFERIAMIPVGVPDSGTADGWPASPPKKPLDEVVVFETIT